MADSPVDEKDALLTEAAAEIESGDAVDDAVAGDVRGYLRAYYRHVALEDLVQAGVINPTKVTRTALQNAASIASLMLTTEAMIAEIPEKKSSAPAGPGHGPEMDY